MSIINPDEDPTFLIQQPEVASVATLVEELRRRGRFSFEGYLQALDILNRPERYSQLMTDFVLTDDSKAYDSLSTGLLNGLGNTVFYAEMITRLDPTVDAETVTGQLTSEGYDECPDILNENQYIATNRPNPLADPGFTEQLQQLMQRLPHSYCDRQNAAHLMPELLGGVEVSPRYQGFLAGN